MNAPRFYSCLATHIESFIRLRQACTTSDYRSPTEALVDFDRFLVKQQLQERYITRHVTDEYQQRLTALAPRTRANRFRVIRQFCEYLNRIDPRSDVPELLRPIPSYAAHHPHIYSRKEVQALMAAAADLSPGSLRPHVYRTLLGLLYSTGMRIGEALALNIGDFYPNEQRLYVRVGKFRKSRWVALSTSTCSALQQYVKKRLGASPRSPDSPMWLHQCGARLRYPTAYFTLRKLLIQCGMAQKGHAGPRLHDLRHSFAVYRLLAWYRDGLDVNTRLPALATHLGHVSIASTQIYLRPTAELLGEVHNRFHDHYLQNVKSGEEKTT